MFNFLNDKRLTMEMGKNDRIDPNDIFEKYLSIDKLWRMLTNVITNNRFLNSSAIISAPHLAALDGLTKVGLLPTEWVSLRFEQEGIWIWLPGKVYAKP